MICPELVNSFNVGEACIEARKSRLEKCGLKKDFFKHRASIDHRVNENSNCVILNGALRHLSP